MKSEYRDSVIYSLLELEKMKEMLDRMITVLAMAGEFKEIFDRFETGNVLSLNVLDFENADDQNIQILFPLFNSLFDVSSSLMNINAIKDEEVEEYQSEGQEENSDQTNDDYLPF